MPARRRLSPRALAVTAMLVLLAIVAPADAWDETGTHTRFAGEPTAMGQTNGPVWTVQIAGGRIFAGGQFTSTRPARAAAGSGETGQAFLAAFDADTGEPDGGFRHTLTNDWTNGPATVRASVLSPDRRTLYVGGDFNLVDGKRAEHLAAFDTATGAFLGQVGWNGVNGAVHSLAVSPDGATLYVGGTFSRANWTDRRNLAAFRLADGALTAWGATITSAMPLHALNVLALAVSSDGGTVFVAGPFQGINGRAVQGFAGVDAGTGAVDQRYLRKYLNPGTSFGTSLAVQGDTVYLGGRDDITLDPARTEGVFAITTATGAVRWYTGCYGDTFAVLPVGDEVYAASHAHDCQRAGGLVENIQWLAGGAFSASTGAIRPWFPQTSGDPWVNSTMLVTRTLASDGEQLVMAGGFLKVNDQPQANIVRFRTNNAPPARSWASATSSCWDCKTVQLNVVPSWDRDDIDLTYRVYRNRDTTTPVAVLTRRSLLWPRSNFTMTDPGPQPVGTKVFYRIEVSDPGGNRVWSVDTNTVTVGR